MTATRLVLAGVLTAGVLTSSAAAAGPPKADPGSRQVVGVTDGVTMTTSTSGKGRYRCASVVRLASVCAVPEPDEGPLLVTHEASEGAKPKLRHLIVAGLAGDDAVRIRVRVRRDVREITPRRFGAYLAVFPATARQRDLVITIRLRSGKTRTIDYRASKPRFRPVPGSDRVEHTLTEQGSPVPLGQVVWRTVGGELCQQVGELVDGRVGSLLGRTFAEYPINDGGLCTRVAADPPIAPVVSNARGRVTISGFAHASVERLVARLADGTEIPLPLSKRSKAFAAVLSSSVEGIPAVTFTATLAGGGVFTLPMGGAPAPPAPLTR